tara:strand:- start:3162 stop:4502 length:1341 start_codon:yes stop_codon:yes gene_type:complete
MDIKVCSVGGYSEVGKNMTAIKYGSEAVVFDCGFYLPKVVSFEDQGGDRRTLTGKKLLNIGAIPDYRVLDSWKKNIKAVALSHCHLDHIGAVPYACSGFKAPVVGTPFTLDVLKNMIKDDHGRVNNEFWDVDQNKVYDISKSLSLEFVNVTHSTPETSIIVLHTPEGAILYVNDYKLDNHPIVGRKPNYQRLKQIVKDEGVKCLIVNSLYSGSPRKTPSESVAREMLKDVMLGVDNNGKALFATCFASHIARLKSMIEFGKKLDREILVFGRSMRKYISGAEEAGLVNFSKDVQLVTYGRQIEKKLRTVEKNRDKYFIICTGGQAEPGAVLTRILRGELNFKFMPEDHVIFSNQVIPVEPNIENRGKMEKTLTKKNVRYFTNIHVSGHGGREDLRDLINMLEPENVIPTHGDDKLVDPAMELAKIMGYKKGNNVHRMHDGDVLKLK